MDVSYYKEKYEPIDGKWYIKELLGKGGYGSVFRIEREDLGGKYDAALKVVTIPKSESELDSVKETLGDDDSVKQYFTNMTMKMVEEFKLMAQLKGNTNIVSYEDHEIISHETGFGYDILIRMELLKPLNKIKEGFSEQDVIKIGIDICRALEVCQKYNIVHRDIKPENIFVSPIGDYKLGDFGVARTMQHEMTVMTTTGTYVYMAPELKKGEECGINVDIYSLGMVMYKLLNFNREPFLPLPPEMFTFDQREEALIKRMKGDPLPKPANAGDRLAEIILKACEYNPKIRYEGPAQMRIELESLILNDKPKSATIVEPKKAEIVEEQQESPKTEEINEVIETPSLPNISEAAIVKEQNADESKPDTAENEYTTDEAESSVDTSEEISIYRVSLVKKTKKPNKINVYVDGMLHSSDVKDSVYSFVVTGEEHNIAIEDATALKATGTKTIQIGKHTIETAVNSNTVINFEQKINTNEMVFLSIDRYDVESNVENTEQNAPLSNSKLSTVPDRCPKCGEVNGWKNVNTQKKFSVGKAIGGAAFVAATAGTGAIVGLAMGALGKKKSVYLCSKCGFTKDYKFQKEKN